MDDRLLTANEVGSRLSVGRSLIYRLAADGLLPSVRIRSAGSRRGALRFFESDVREYLRRLRAESRGEIRRTVDPDALRRRVLRRGSA